MAKPIHDGAAVDSFRAVRDDRICAANISHGAAVYRGKGRMKTMNKKNLDELVQNYIKDFDFINNDHAEYYKWEAVEVFQQNWNTDAPDFASMFKAATSKTYNLINNHVAQPVNGIIKLAENKELTEQVRELFRFLFYTEDNGVISNRQERIEQFVKQANALLAVHEPGKWKYEQDLRTGLMYLNMFAPSQNYFYKATQARAFMQCIEYEDDFGRGTEFDLETYYAMCDSLVAYIKASPELQKKHKDRMTDKMYRDDDWHILAFDLIYCALSYDLYKGIDILVPAKAVSKMVVEQEKLVELQKEITQLQTHLFELEKEYAAFEDISAEGLELDHSVFGKGTVVKQDNKYLTIRFEKEEKRFLIPDSFKTGRLKFLDPEIGESITTMIELEHQIEIAEEDLKALKAKLRRMSLVD
jgi:hypothetical protein